MEWVSEPDARGRVSGKEATGVILCGLLFLGLRFWGLRAAQVSVSFDEGVHLSLMQMLANGQGSLYRDLLFIHPPGLIWAGARLWGPLHGSLFLLRSVYVLFCGLGFVPMYAIARRLYGVRCALITLALLAASPGFANWLGRNIYLELPLNVFVYTALWALLRGGRPCWPTCVLAGALLGVGYLIKETAAVIAFAMFAALWAAGLRPARSAVVPETEPAEGRTGSGAREASPRGAAWAFAAAFVVVLGAILICLYRVPHYGLYTVTLNARDPYRLGGRLYELLNGFYALPIPLTFGAAGVVLMARRSRNAEERFLALFTILLTLIVFFLPRRFFWRHLAPVLPLYCLGAAIWWERFRAGARRARRIRLPVVLGTLFGLVHCADLILYHTHESVNPPAYHEALRVLRDAPGPLFTLDPIWAPASGRALYPWPFACDAVFARQYDLASPAEFTAVLLRCPTVLLDDKTLSLIPADTLRTVHQRYRCVFRHGSPHDRDFVEIYRRLPGN